MALINTSPDSSDCENNFRMALAEELGAQKTYRELRNQIYYKDGFPPNVKEELLRRLDEIIKDEEQHSGSLLFCLNLLNPEFTKNMHNGSTGS